MTRDWLSTLPIRWTQKRADALLEYRKVPISRHQLEQSDVFHYSIPVVQETGDGLIEFGSDIESDKILLTGDELIVSKLNPHKGCVMLVEPHELPIVASTEFVPLVTRPGFDRRYAYYVYSSLPARASISSSVTSATRSHQRASPEDITKLWLPVPPLDQQRTIADYLDRETAQLDALIAEKERLLRLLDEKRRALITRAVTRGLDPSVPFRDSGTPWLGKVPTHWRRCHLKRALDSADYGISESVDSSGRVAVLRMGDIRDGEIDYTRIGYVSDVDEALLLQPGDLLFNRTNSMDQIGKVAIFRGYPHCPVSFASYLVRLRCSPRVLPEFLNWYLNSVYAQSWGRAHALPAIGQANLSPNRHGYLPVALPPATEQRLIMSSISASSQRLRAVHSATQNTVALLKERRSSIVAAAVTGQIDPEKVA